MKKKTLTIALCILILIIFILLSAYISFRQSVKYATYELTLAQKYQDSQIALQYYDIEKIAESVIAKTTEELTNDDNPFSGLGISMINNMKDSIIAKYRKDITEQYETEYPELKSCNNLKILYYTLSDKSTALNKLTYKTISKNKVIQIFSDSEGNSLRRTWVKDNKNKKWVIIELNYD